MAVAGRLPILVPVEIDNPNALSGTDPKHEPPKRIPHLRNVRDDPLGWMHARKQVDDVQLLAGRHWEGLYERACIGQVQALDTTKEPVDGGGRFPEPVTVSQLSAMDELRALKVALEKSAPGDDIRGRDRFRLVNDIIALGMLPTQAAAIRGKHHWRQVKGLVREFRTSMDVIAKECNLGERLLRKTQKRLDKR